MNAHQLSIAIQKHMNNGMKPMEAIEAALIEHQIKLDPFRKKVLANLIEKEQAEMAKRKIDVDAVSEKEFEKLAKK